MPNVTVASGQRAGFIGISTLPRRWPPSATTRRGAAGTACVDAGNGQSIIRMSSCSGMLTGMWRSSAGGMTRHLMRSKTSPSGHLNDPFGTRVPAEVESLGGMSAATARRTEKHRG